MENLTGALVIGGSAVAGAAASNLLVAELTAKSSGDAKKDSNRKKLVKGGAVVASSWRPAYEDISYTEVSEEPEELPARNPLVGFTPKESYL